MSLICLWATNVNAESVGEPVAPEAEPGATALTPEPVASGRDIGFRNGFSLSAGHESGTTASGADISGQL